MSKKGKKPGAGDNDDEDIIEFEVEDGHSLEKAAGAIEKVMNELGLSARVLYKGLIIDVELGATAEDIINGYSTHTALKALTSSRRSEKDKSNKGGSDKGKKK